MFKKAAKKMAFMLADQEPPPLPPPSVDKKGARKTQIARLLAAKGKGRSY
jgi:hypothetical protein